jgi:opacity protein-like surface antigen
MKENKVLVALLLGLATLVAFPASSAAVPQEQEQDPELQPPPPPDAIGGPNATFFVGSMFGASTSGQAGGSFGYTFKPDSTFGVEVEGGLTFGPDGRVIHLMGHFLMQTGARTSRIVFYAVIGAGIMYATFDPRPEIQSELDRLGIVIEDSTEVAPGVSFGAGVKYYLREGLSLRADYREYRMRRDIEGSFSERLYTLRRLAGMFTFEF